MRGFVALLVRHRAWAPVAAFALTAPSLFGGVELDDLFHQRLARDGGDLVLGAFRFVDAGNHAAHLAAADMPWWTEPGMRLSLLRPLAGLTHWLDWTLWPGTPWAMHLVSVLLYVALVAMVGILYRRAAPRPDRAALATWIFALSQAHGMNVGWISARNSVLGTLLAAAALLVHRAARDRQRPPLLVASSLLFALALSANEGAVSVIGYLIAFAVVLDRGRARWWSLTPYLAVVVLWRVLTRHLGFGAASSGMYLEPLSDPLAYVGRTIVHGFVLLAARFGIAGVDGLGAVPGGYVLALIGAVPFVVAIGWLAWPRMRDDAQLRAWGLGALLTLGTAGALVPTDRNLLMLGLGACVLIADLILHGLDARGVRRWAARGFVAVHLGLAVVLLPLRTLSSTWVQGMVAPIEAALPVDDDVATRSVVVLNAPSDLIMMYARVSRELRGGTAPGRIVYLYAGPGAVELERSAQDAITLRSSRPWLAAPLDRMYRSMLVMEPGAPFAGPCFDAVVEEVEDGLPTAVRFELHGRGASCEPVFMAWEGEAPRLVELPPIGAAVTLAPAILPAPPE